MSKRTPDTELLPTLDLSGPALRSGFEELVAAAEPGGGMDVYLTALQFKSKLFGEWFLGKQSAALDTPRFLGLCTFMPTVRRRVGAWLGSNDFADLHRQLLLLMQPGTTVQARFDAFVAAFPTDRTCRWARDLAAEVLHFCAPDEIPLMTRWMWDAQSGSGVLREIWFNDSRELDPRILDVGCPSRRIARDHDPLHRIPDRLATFVALKAELETFLRDNGTYRDFGLMQDLLCAHIYSRYINDRGSTYLKGDFAGAEDAMAHTRRLLGLDCYERDGIRMKVKLPETMSVALATPLQLDA
ncbi:MAG: hypothetical protein ACYCUX_13080 [Metallibacterium sp.]